MTRFEGACGVGRTTRDEPQPIGRTATRKTPRTVGLRLSRWAAATSFGAAQSPAPPTSCASGSAASSSRLARPARLAEQCVV